MGEWLIQNEPVIVWEGRQGSGMRWVYGRLKEGSLGIVSEKGSGHHWVLYFCPL